MSLFHLEAKIIGGKNSTLDASHACAYRHRLKITGGADYAKKMGLVESFIIAPSAIAQNGLKIDPMRFWTEVDIFEHLTRKDAQKAREVQISLHSELSLEENTALLKKFVQEQFVDLGMLADVVIHQPPDNPTNIHAHIMLTLRELIPDHDGVRFGKKVRAWNDRKLLLQWRQAWERHSNEVLAERNLPTITSKSYSTLYREAKERGDKENMEIYGALMRYKAHFNAIDLRESKEIIDSTRNEKKRLESDLRGKYANLKKLTENKDLKNVSRISSNTTRANLIEQITQNAINRNRNRIGFNLSKLQRCHPIRCRRSVPTCFGQPEGTNLTAYTNKKHIFSYEAKRRSDKSHYPNWSTTYNTHTKIGLDDLLTKLTNKQTSPINAHRRKY